MIAIFILKIGSAQWQHQHLPFVRTDNGTSHPMCAALATLAHCRDMLPWYYALAAHRLQHTDQHLRAQHTAATKALLRCTHHVHVLGQSMLLFSIKSWLAPIAALHHGSQACVSHCGMQSRACPAETQLEAPADVVVESSPRFFVGLLLHRTA